jgi:hypothetical protein|tara:strand:- start:425 stop:643 length:219 start_codon:yes stop_codon:yes gene_type:complete
MDFQKLNTSIEEIKDDANYEKTEVDLNDVSYSARITAIETLMIEYYIKIFTKQLENNTCEEQILTELYKMST